jgi:hypothetical protein
MKQSAHEAAFLNLTDRVLSMTKEELNRREAEYRKQVDANPRRRGPKRKAVKPPSASPGPVS